MNPSEDAKIAVPEKALLDVLYLSPSRTRLFVKLPEIEYPRKFRWRIAFEMAAKIKSRARRAFVKKGLSLMRSSSTHEKRH
ncbi:MAG: hypothetical protein DMF25_02585 [Verrucomicrobia bacterium]|nr:MAG: hypothetical protein DMF25_02585 [Verrucomicrobiota bacterium]